MRRHPAPHEIVGDEAVEQCAEHVLLVGRERSAQAEDGVHADRCAGRIAAISVSRFVAAATSRYASRERVKPAARPSRSRTAAIPARLVTRSRCTTNGSRCLPSMTGSPPGTVSRAGPHFRLRRRLRQTAVGLSEAVSAADSQQSLSSARVQLPPKRRVPATAVAERGMGGRQRLDQPCVTRIGQVGYRHLRAGQPLDRWPASGRSGNHASTRVRRGRARPSGRGRTGMPRMAMGVAPPRSSPRSGRRDELERSRCGCRRRAAIRGRDVAAARP